MPETTLFEHPLNEKCRTWLRLSHLFEQFEFHMPHAEQWHARAAMSALLDIAAVLARADIKSELLKEFDRYRQSLSRMADTPGVDADRLRQILESLTEACEGIRQINGQLGQALRGNEFLNSVVQRSSIAGGSFDFDLPQYHYWLQMPQEARLPRLAGWHREVKPVQDAVVLLLALIRNSAVPTQQSAANGFYQKSVPGSVTAHLVRVGLSCSDEIYAEISGGKHRFSIRFMDCSDWQHPNQVDREVTFTLSTCLM